MGAITLDGILKAEHDVLHEALTEWCGMVKEDASADIQYVIGVHDMAHELVKRLEGDSGNGDN